MSIQGPVMPFGYFINSECPKGDIRHMDSHDQKDLSNVGGEIAKFDQNTRLYKSNNHSDTTIKTGVNYPKTSDFVKLPNIRPMKDRSASSLQVALAGRSVEIVALKRAIDIELKKGNVETAEYLLGRELSAEELAKGKVDYEKKLHYPKTKNHDAIYDHFPFGTIPDAPRLHFVKPITHAPVINNTSDFKSDVTSFRGLYDPLKDFSKIRSIHFNPDSDDAIISKHKNAVLHQISKPHHLVHSNPNIRLYSNDGDIIDQDEIDEHRTNSLNIGDTILDDNHLKKQLDELPAKTLQLEEFEKMRHKEIDKRSPIEQILNSTAPFGSDFILLKDLFAKIGVQQNIKSISKKIPKVELVAIIDAIKEHDPTYPIDTSGTVNRRKLMNDMNKEFNPQRGYGVSQTSCAKNAKRQDISFGKYFIDKNKLNRNILSFAQKNHHTINALPNVKITDAFKNVITQMLSGIDVSVNELSPREQEYLNHVIVKSQIKFNNQVPSSKSSLINRLSLITGQIDVGNNSKLLKNELSQLLNHMLTKRLISATQAKQMTERYIESL